MTDTLPLCVFLSRYGFTALVVFSGSTVIVKDGAGKGTLYSIRQPTSLGRLSGGTLKAKERLPKKHLEMRPRGRSKKDGAN